MGWVASQLGRPRGAASGLVAAMLNRTNREIINEAVRTLDLGSGAVGADLGFGGGLGLRLLLERVHAAGRVYGVDISPEMVRRAATRFHAEVASGRLVLHEGSITSLPLDDASVEGAITINTIYFIAELDQAFAEMARVVKTTGVVVVGIGDPDFMARMPMTPYGFRLRPVDQVVSTAASAGLQLRNHSRAGPAERASHLLAFSRADS
jgi:arsenite methyltransferase